MSRSAARGAGLLLGSLLGPLLGPLFALMLGATANVGAAPVEVRVSGPGGGAVAGAVVFLEPRDGPAPAAPALKAEIAQIGRKFVPEVTIVPVGTAVEMPNRDTVRHHVYSFSPAKRFELKLYVGTPASPVVFDQTGIAVLGCNIHDSMTAWVVIVDTPWYGQTGPDGRLLLAAVPPGRYRLRAWHPAREVGATPIEQPLQVGAGALTANVALTGLRP